MSVVVVLHRPQDLVNIASVVRAMNNFELADLRLVAPLEYDERRIEGIAHQSRDLIDRIRIVDALDEALADCTYAAGMTARERTVKRNVERPRDAAAALLVAAGTGRAALVLGPEDRGLTNEELDRCHRAIVVPTSPDHPSLNLAQAFTVMAYELYLARDKVRAFKPPRRGADLATQNDVELLFADAEAALQAIDFFKTRNPSAIMRSVREAVHRTPLDAREAKLFRAMCIEVVRYLERVGAR